MSPGVPTESEMTRRGRSRLWIITIVACVGVGIVFVRVLGKEAVSAPTQGVTQSLDYIQQEVTSWVEQARRGERVKIVELAPTTAAEDNDVSIVEGHLGLLEGMELASTIQGLEGLVASRMAGLVDQPTETLESNYDAALLLYRYEQAQVALACLYQGNYLVMDDGESLSVPNTETMVYPVRKDGKQVDVVFVFDETVYPALRELGSHADALKRQMLVEHIAEFNYKPRGERQALLEMILPGPNQIPTTTNEDRQRFSRLRRDLLPSGVRANQEAWTLELAPDR